VAPAGARRRPDCGRIQALWLFTAQGFLSAVETRAAQGQVGMDGHGRVMDHIFSERLWRTKWFPA
jgi:hypothetical protein